MEYLKAIRFRNTVLTAALITVLAIIHPSFNHQTHDQAVPPKPAYKVGIDVSHYQGDINWSDLKKHNQVHFAFVKATEGLHFVDPRSQDNFRGLKQADIPFGSYHFFHPNLNAEQQARFFIQHVSRPLVMPPVLDIELSQGMKPEQIRAAAKIWLTKVEQDLGCKPIIYTGLDYWKSFLGPEFNDYKIWLAEYQNKLFTPADMAPWSIWQSTEHDSVQGINGSVDKNQLDLKLNSLESLLC